ncbi:hypothetical protein [Nocardioides coralli]|uniref:hypothetical protein n=1 Tax=Nocardioides coralli TaxID=2872154 RepID=UPI001CA443F2|nr:hypothetical protein [Nocardioides coralli]QZY30270.1 hypothetical protein K6T13_06255 [Nocardioides coralli]
MGTRRLLVATALGALLLTGCAAEGPAPRASQDEPTPPATAEAEPPEVHHADIPEGDSRPLREGERRLTLRMPAAYTPSAPHGAGSDDYRCFLLDPRLRQDSYLTGTHVIPGNREVVHHVILFRVPPEQVERARTRDDLDDGPGWTCFGGTGVDDVTDVDDAGWLGAWAPGGEESVHRRGLGVPLEAGSQIVMQVHYNLLAGDEPDASATQLRLAPGDADITGLGTMLLPGPVELPCRKGHRGSPLCDRDAALADVQERFGPRAGATANLLHLLCGSKPRPGNTQSCTRTLSEPMTVHGVAGHMHLLGRSITIETNAGTDRARTLLDIPVWDFDDQGARPTEPVRLSAFDQVTVTCRHVQWLRDRLPAFEGQDERYVLWGEGTTDEMCLGILQVTRP